MSPEEQVNILKRAIPISEVKEDPLVTALIYGRSGTGKTTMTSTFPKPILHLDIKDKGTDSIKDVAGINVFEVENWLEFESIFWALEKGDHEYKTIVIDTVSNLQSMAIEEVKRREHIDEGASMSQRLWGASSALLQQWIYHYRDLPMNVVFVAQERGRKGSDDENYDDQLDPEVGPAVMPSVAKVLNAAVKVIGNTYVKQVEVKHPTKIGDTITETRYMMRVGPHAYYITKIRAPKSFKIPGSIRNPSYDEIIRLMRGEKKEATTNV